MKRRVFKRRNPMAAVVRRIKPKRIASAKDYRRKVKHRKPLRDMSSEAVFVCAGCRPAMRSSRFLHGVRRVMVEGFTTNGHR